MMEAERSAEYVPAVGDRVQDETGLVGTVYRTWDDDGGWWIEVTWDPSTLRADEVSRFDQAEEDRTVAEHLGGA